MNAWPALRTTPSGDPGPELSESAWLSMPEDTSGEWARGRLEEEEVPDVLHELAISWLMAVLRTWLSGKGFVIGSEAKLLVAAQTGRKADVVMFLPGSAPPPRRGPIRNPPDVLVEVVTSTPRDERRDRVEKMSEYAAFGVRWYWILDPALGSFEVFERDAAGRYARAAAATEGRLEVPGCKGLVVDLDALWGELARLPEE
ncbi:MAG: Uma2 family endonuclease [Deltaproteobacteria bacterium]|nr:Uma2 family endonuclease [Deltaproteobacteria bacterium]